MCVKKKTVKTLYIEEPPNKKSRTTNQGANQDIMEMLMKARIIDSQTLGNEPSGATSVQYRGTV